ncbi:hypothetical protein [Dyadobacter alkalitolerans]|uniref:hypothetical protein n=1 Tax=Dyadobacter alkalitolerans TaxID=492736 RepID=UPI000409AAB7|nr:hypothetical protein [Dyadobacter alkalitolerans]
MLTEFELLIQELEFEMSVLDEELQECLRFQDYKYAHYYQKGIWRIQRRIERLNRLNRNPTSLDTQHLVDAIIELNDNQISSFSLIFVKGSDFYLHFHRLDNNSLYCQIPTESEMQRAHYYVYQPYMKKNISSLGFQLFEESSGIEFTVEPSQSCDTILTKLAVLMFDILQVRMDASGYIEKKVQ